MVGSYWTLTDSTSINFENILVNDKNIYFYNKTHGCGGSGNANPQVAFAVAIANCNPNESNEIKITAKSVGINFSITKYYEIYGIK